MPTVIKIDDQYAIEESTGKITIAFTDEDDNAVIPSTITWTLTDESGTIINEREDIAVAVPASTINIGLSGDDLAFQSGESGDSVFRIFTIEWTYTSVDLGSDLPGKDSLKFPLVNLVAVT